MKKTNFDEYLEEQLKDPEFQRRFEHAGESWDVALQIAALRQQAGLSQKELAKALKTSQQQVSRLESPGYEGHSVSTLRRVAAALKARIRISFEPLDDEAAVRPNSVIGEWGEQQVAERTAPYLKGGGKAKKHRSTDRD